MISKCFTKTRTATVLATYVLFLISYPTIQVMCCCDHHYIDKQVIPKAIFSYLPNLIGQTTSIITHHGQSQIFTKFNEAVDGGPSQSCSNHQHILTTSDDEVHLIPIRSLSFELSSRCYLSNTLIDSIVKQLDKSFVSDSPIMVREISTSLRNTVLLI